MQKKNEDGRKYVLLYLTVKSLRTIIFKYLNNLVLILQLDLHEWRL